MLPNIFSTTYCVVPSGYSICLSKSQCPMYWIWILCSFQRTVILLVSHMWRLSNTFDQFLKFCSNFPKIDIDLFILWINMSIHYVHSCLSFAISQPWAELLTLHICLSLFCSLPPTPTHLKLSLSDAFSLTHLLYYFFLSRLQWYIL